MIKFYIIPCILLFLNFTAWAQDSRQVNNTNTSVSSKSVASPQKRYKSFKKHPYNIYYDRLIVEYEQRMKANAKKYKVMARKMQKPQYSDPSYFGHKRKPRKRPVGKRKYCKECEIVH